MYCMYLVKQTVSTAAIQSRLWPPVVGFLVVDHSQLGCGPAAPFGIHHPQCLPIKRAMKLFRQRSLLFAGLPRPRLHKTSSYADVLDTYHSSNSATDVSVFSPHVDETGFLRPSRRQVVSFCEEDNESYTSPWLITTDRDCPSRSNDNPQTQQQQQQQQQQQPDGMTILVSQKSVWYTNDDIAKFKHEQEVYGRLIVNREKLSSSLL